MRSRLIKALNNRFYVKFMQLEIGLFSHGLQATEVKASSPDVICIIRFFCAIVPKLKGYNLQVSDFEKSCV